MSILDTLSGKPDWRKDGFQILTRYCPFIEFLCETGPRRAFPTAAIQAINYVESAGLTKAEIIIAWTTDVVSIEGEGTALGKIYEAVLSNECRSVAFNGKSVLKVTIDPIEPRQEQTLEETQEQV